MMQFSKIFFSILSSVSIFLTALAVQASPATPSGPGTSGGGDTVVAEFIYLADQLISALKSVGKIEIRGAEFNVEILNEQLQDLIQRDGISTTSTQPILNGQPKDLINDWAARTILIYRVAWESADLRRKQLIIIHELLGLARIQDEFYQTSRPLMQFLAQQSSDTVTRSRVDPADRPTRIEAPINFSGTYVLQSQGGSFTPSAPIVNFRGYNANPKDEYNHVDGSFSCLVHDRPVISIQIRQEENRLGFRYRIVCLTQTAGAFAVSAGGSETETELLITRDQRIMYMGVEIGWISGKSIFINGPSRLKLTQQSGGAYRFSIIDEDGPGSGRVRSLEADVTRVNQP